MKFLFKLKKKLRKSLHIRFVVFLVVIVFALQGYIFAGIDGPKIQHDPVTEGKLVKLQNEKHSFIGTNMWYKSFDGKWHYLDGKGDYTVGWYHDLDDDNWYYFDKNGDMVTGKVIIFGEEYYFSEQVISNNWYYDDKEAKYKVKEKGIKSLGSMYKNEYVPDGSFANEQGICTKS